MLDKDGTLLREDPDSTHPAAFVFMPGAPTMLVRLHSAGFHICVAANQPGVAFGRFQETALAGLSDIAAPAIAGNRRQGSSLAR